jgi:4-hydroxy-tetrahydrodipicolinate reductase
MVPKLTSPYNIVVAGGRGHMGQAVVSALKDDPAFRHVGNLARHGSAGDGVIDLATALDVADVIIDFTTGEAATALTEACAARGGPALVIGATGFTPQELGRFKDAARRIAIVRSGNFSLGVNMLVGLVAQAAQVLRREIWDIEIFEAHHRRKVDAPSGTALMLGEAAAQGLGVSLASVERRSRDGISGERQMGEIGFSVMRGGSIVGEHGVTFAAADEVVTLSHQALDRSMFAHGALAAARWLIGRAPGEYDMQDVLGLKR